MRAAALIVALAACDSALGLDPIAAPKAWRKSITVTNNTGVELDDFVVTLTWPEDADLAAHAADKNAIEFVDLDGQPMQYEITSFVTPAGSFDAFVDVPSLVAGDTMFWMQYGEQDYPPPESPWIGHYAAVWHESGTGMREYDHGPNGHDLQATTASYPTTTPGVVGFARMYDGIAEPMCDGHINSTLDFGTGSFSYSVWVNVPVLGATAQIPFYKGGSASMTPGFDTELAAFSTAQINDMGTGHVTSGFGTLMTNAWEQLAVTVDRGGAVVMTYRDGLQADTVAITALSSVSGAIPICLGATDIGAYPLLGSLDEPRVYDAAMPAQWFRLEYQNYTDRNHVVAVGAEQVR